ncbi:MAG: hypothetical protein FJ296_01325 [Planctomycetes bacterium]|nr:hypothetical protein [Planctomycetota bacterium]
MDRAPQTSARTRRFAALALVVALAATGCVYDDHASYGATEKWVHSDVNYVPKIIGTPFIAIFDGLVSPATAAVDYMDDDVYHPDHLYFSYAGSRVIGRSDMGGGYAWGASIFSIILETAWLPITGLADLVIVLTDDDGRLGDEVAAR